jgi:RNA polymerase sigma-70 factor (ECF subfamily)
LNKLLPIAAEGFGLMASDGHLGNPRLTVVEGGGTPDKPSATSAARDVEWSIFMARAQSGDAQAYQRLLMEITPYLRTLVGRHHRVPQDVEDTVQDILLTIHSVRNIYDPSRPFTPWLVAIARRRIIDRLRKQGRTSAHEIPLEDDHAEIGNDGSAAEDRAEGRRLREAVKKLPPAQREAVTLLKLEEMSLREASEKTGMSIVSLKVSTHRALKSLRTLLGGSEKP